jgi:hypothetical protein
MAFTLRCKEMLAALAPKKARRGAGHAAKRAQKAPAATTTLMLLYSSR